MDPNAALREIREIVVRINTVEELSQDAGRLVDLVKGLDRWLSNGGFLPEAWGEP